MGGLFNLVDRIILSAVHYAQNRDPIVVDALDNSKRDPDYDQFAYVGTDPFALIRIAF